MNSADEKRDDAIARARARLEEAFLRFQQVTNGLAARRRIAVARALRRREERQLEDARKQLGL